MREIGNVVISDEVWNSRFSCDLSRCLGKCCQYGDLGAPISEDEELVIKNHLDAIEPLISRHNLQLLRGGITERYKGCLHIVEVAENTPCPLAFIDENNIVLCSLHRYTIDKNLPLLDVKPLWCSLFPLMIKQTASGWLINCHIPDFCRSTDNPQPLLLSFADLLQDLFGAEWIDAVKAAYLAQSDASSAKHP